MADAQRDSPTLEARENQVERHSVIVCLNILIKGLNAEFVDERLAS